ncbi:transcriptional regulator [Cellvibrio mixtus]|uniref:Transcriptional regulator n=1 Tax=Cellvibrio mixtus TaxID=39650 RepID=A0A266Q1X4_9GAMM|nr:IclR family transcriptional regulator [Cellvibrio mixtus]OZY83877.1 transcriptional regulator [Cellvibrio mixtus]
MTTMMNAVEPMELESAEDTERKYRAPALEKGLDILELLARSSSPLTTSQMAAQLGRSVSELFRMVLALEYRGYISQMSDGRDGYILTNKLFTLGIAQGTAKTLLEVALPTMKDLCRELGQSCHLVVPSGDQIVVIARQESPMDLGFSVRVGYRRRLIDTNSGALLYGFASPDVQASWLPQLSATVDLERIERFLARARRGVDQGYIQLNSDFVDGVTDFCMPVIGAQGAVAVLIIPFINIKAQSISTERVLERLMQAADKISQGLID